MTCRFPPDRHGRAESNGIFAAAKMTQRSSPQRASSPGTPISDDKTVAKMGPPIVGSVVRCGPPVQSHRAEGTASPQPTTGSRSSLALALGRFCRPSGDPLFKDGNPRPRFFAGCRSYPTSQAQLPRPPGTDALTRLCLSQWARVYRAFLEFVGFADEVDG
jgi:hypothetical protein